MPSPYAPMPRCLYPAQVAAKEAEVQTLKQRLHTSGSGRMGGGGGDASASGLGSITFHLRGAQLAAMDKNYLSADSSDPCFTPPLTDPGLGLGFGF